jgi:hypothetical protein
LAAFFAGRLAVARRVDDVDARRVDDVDAGLPDEVDVDLVLFASPLSCRPN